MTTHGISTKPTLPYDKAIATTREVLQTEGFGVIAEIGVKNSMKEKLGVDFRSCIILGASNLTLAHKMLSADLKFGLFLPCNVVVYEADGGTVVSSIDPTARLGEADNANLDAVPAEVRQRLLRVVDRVGES